jgi:hypothetical protein
MQDVKPDIQDFKLCRRLNAVKVLGRSVVLAWSSWPNVKVNVKLNLMMEAETDSGSSNVNSMVI